MAWLVVSLTDILYMPCAIEQILLSERLPSLPQIAVRVIELAREEEPDLGELIRTVRNDPALSSKMMRTVNSAIFGLRRKVDSIEKAIPMLGITMVRTMVLGFTLANQKSHGIDLQRPLQRLWRSSLTQATFAELLADRIPGADPASYFLAGLLQDIGILACIQALGEEYLSHVWDRSAFPNVVASEREYLGYTHPEVSAALCHRWGLPDAMCHAIAHHHRRLLPDSCVEQSPLDTALLAANLCAQYVENLPNSGDQHFDELVAVLLNLLNWPIEDTEELLRETIVRVGETAALYAFDVGRGWPVDRILNDAKRILEEIALHSQLQSLTKSSSGPGGEKKSRRQLEDDAMRDAMTGVYNRRYLDRVLSERIANNIRLRKPMGFLFLDIDRFKSVNDQHGHQQGDHAIRLVAQISSRAVRKSDAVVRFGGDEFLMVLSNVTAANVERIAERIRAEIRSTPIAKNLNITVTSSIGAVHYQPLAEDPAGAHWLIDTVDKAMYEAKRGGGDQIHFFQYSGQNLLQVA